MKKQIIIILLILCTYLAIAEYTPPNYTSVNMTLSSYTAPNHTSVNLTLQGTSTGNCWTEDTINKRIIIPINCRYYTNSKIGI